MSNNPMTHKQRRAAMTGALYSITKARQRARIAKRVMIEKRNHVPHTSNWLICDWNSPLKEFLTDGRSVTGALSKYIDHLESKADTYISCIGEMTGFGYFDFNDWWGEVFRGAYHMVEAERHEKRLHQSAYANRQVVATVTKQILLKTTGLFDVVQEVGDD